MEPLELVYAFPCLIRTIAYNNSNWEAVYHNLRKDRQRCGVISKVLAKTEVTVQARGIIFKAVVHTVLLYGR